MREDSDRCPPNRVNAIIKAENNEQQNGPYTAQGRLNIIFYE
jgi:hypothetical protein